ncbi:PDZ domain-containing protein [Candidatus Chloroploca sp. M-50]|uniref:PDZ domain-containing protein n=1 Tax=Candidatus Chloroploca mongolica TaxID=2528176 RepID=A0ABS4D3T7_9CHLR|nr:S41 family peptidase [Candidatus Chloroploca mongolica]MBP1464108.1 PDZ domain-containing protein [Candidatus Chloroploca mongolica]
MNRLLRSIMLLLIILGLLAGCTQVPWAALNPTPVPPSPVPPSPMATLQPSPEPTSTPRPTATPLPSPTFEPLPPTPTLAPVGAASRLQIFERTWELVRDNYVYEDYRGVDWDEVRRSFTPRVAAAEEPEAFYALMRELIDLLDDDHSRFESPQEVAAQQAEFRGELRYGGIGAQIRTLDEGGLITGTAPDGPAERAGIQLNDLIVAVNGIPFTNTDAFGPDGPIGTVRGEPGTPVTLTIRTSNEAPREVIVIRETVAMDAFNQVRGRFLPDLPVGVVTIPSFYVDELDTKVRIAIEELQAAQPLAGLIIDVRENAGGYVHLMRNTVALFHDGGSIGSTAGRTTSEEQRIPQGKTIPGLEDVPVAILIGSGSASATEMFAAGMQVLGRARIVGEPSAGNTENLYGYNFDDGSRLLLAQVAYRLPDGTLIEERGVIPDRLVEVDWWRYPPDDDPQLRAAVEELGFGLRPASTSP